MASKKDGTSRPGAAKPGETEVPIAAPAEPGIGGEAAVEEASAASLPAVAAEPAAPVAPEAPSAEVPADEIPPVAATPTSEAPAIAGEAEPAPATAEVTVEEASAEVVPSEPPVDAVPVEEPASAEALADAVGSAEPPVPPAPAIPASAAGGPGIGRLVAVAALSTVLGGALGIGGSHLLSGRDAAAVKAELDAGLARSQAKIAELEARIAALPKAPPAFDPTPLEKRIAALEGERVNTGTLTERVGAVEKTLREQAEATSRSVAAALAAVPADASTGAALQAMAGRLDAGLAQARARGDEIATQVKDLGDRLSADFERRATDAAKILEGVRTRLGALESLRGDVDGLIGRIGGVEDATKSLKAAGTKAFEDLGGKATDLAAKLGGVDGRLGKVEAGAQATAKAQSGAVLAVALADLKSAVDAGRPFANEFEVVRRAGTLDLKVLEPFAAKGVPSLTALRERLPAVTRAIAEVQETSEAGDGIVDRMIAHAKQIVRIRPAGTAVGDTVEAKLSRLEAKMKTGELAAALDEWKGLPDAAKKPVADWGAALEARVAVDAALARESAAVLAELSKSTAAR